MKTSTAISIYVGSLAMIIWGYYNNLILIFDWVVIAATSVTLSIRGK